MQTAAPPTFAPSVPPPSYPPQSVAPADTTAPGRVSWPSHQPGWRPADDDDSHAAVAWRARTSLRRADRALGALRDLNENVVRLNATIESWSETWGKHWRTLSRVAWGVGIPVLVAVVLGVGAYVWRWLSTLHH